MTVFRQIRTRAEQTRYTQRKEREQQMTEIYPLRLPKSLKQAVERLSRQEGTSMNQFVALAVAEKVSALETATFFEERRGRADFKAFDKILRRRGGEAPRAGDEMPHPKRAARRPSSARR